MQASTVEKTRTFANKAAVTGIDWDAINKLVHSDAGKHEVASLRATLMDVQSRFEEMAKETAPIDWDRWSKEVDPKVVEGFKKAFEGKFSVACERVATNRKHAAHAGMNQE